MSFDELQDVRRDGTLFVELPEEQFLDLSCGVRDTLLLVPVAVGLCVEKLSIYSER